MFLWEFMPNLRPFKAFSKDMLYYQGDHPEELFFILFGKVQLKYDITEGMVIDRTYNIPFNMYTQGSYFGDIELLLTDLKTNGRDGTAEVDAESSFLFVTKSKLYRTLKSFPNIFREMKYIAGERHQRHQENIQIIQKKYDEFKRDIIRTKVKQDTLLYVNVEEGENNKKDKKGMGN